MSGRSSADLSVTDSRRIWTITRCERPGHGSRVRTASSSTHGKTDTSVYHHRKKLTFKMRLWIRQNYRCGICQRVIRRRHLYTDKVNLDHIVAKSKGGTRDPENLSLVHMSCNQAKADDCPCDWYGPEYCTTDIHGGDGDVRWRR